MESPAQTLRSQVEAFLARTQMPPSQFGSKAVGDPNFVRNLRSGREPRFETSLRVVEFMTAHEEAAEAGTS